MEPNLIVCACGAYVCRYGVPCVMDTPKAVEHPHLWYWTGTFPHLSCICASTLANLEKDSNLVMDAVLMHRVLVQCMAADSCVFPLIDITELWDIKDNLSLPKHLSPVWGLLLFIVPCYCVTLGCVINGEWCCVSQFTTLGYDTVCTFVSHITMHNRMWWEIPLSMVY